MQITIKTFLAASVLALFVGIVSCSKSEQASSSELEEIKQELAELKKEMADSSKVELEDDVKQVSLDDTAFEKAKSDGRVRAYGEYAKSFPEGKHLAAADEGAWASAKRQNSVLAYQAYQSYFPIGKHFGESLKSTSNLQNKLSEKHLADLGYSISDFPSFGAMSINSDGEVEKAILQEPVTQVRAVIGDASRGNGFLYGLGNEHFYNSKQQADYAEANLAQVECLGTKNQFHEKTTSAFFFDAADYAKKHNIIGDFSGCRDRVLLSVAHYINDWQGTSSDLCYVHKSFNTNKSNVASSGKVINISVGSLAKNEEFYPSNFGETSSDGDQHNYTDENDGLDFAILEIDRIKEPNNDTKVSGNIRICDKSEVDTLNYSGFKSQAHGVPLTCKDPNILDDIILPHISSSDADIHAAERGWSYKKKDSSGKCCIRERVADSTIEHTCDMDMKASGAPLLNIKGLRVPCALGIQSAKNKDTFENLAVSLNENARFDAKMKLFLANASCKRM